MIILDILALFVGGIIQIPNVYVLLIFRIMQGVLSGMFLALVPIYIHEISPKEIVGSFGAFTQWNIGFGCLLSYLMGMIFI